MPPRPLSFTSPSVSPSAPPTPPSTPATNKYTILITPHSVENVNASGQLALRLEDRVIRKSDDVLFSSTTTIMRSGRACFDGEKLSLDITLTPMSSFSPQRLSFTTSSNCDSRANTFKQKYITIKLCLENQDGPVVTSTSLFMNRFISSGNFCLPGKKIVIRFEDNSIMKATLAIVPQMVQNGSSNRKQKGRAKSLFNNRSSPTSIMSPFSFPSSSRMMQVKKISETISDITATLKSTVSTNVVVTGVNGVVNKLNIINPLGNARDNGKLLMELKTENEHIERRIATYRMILKNTEAVEVLRRKRSILEVQTNDLMSNGIPLNCYLSYVEQLCQTRETKAEMQLKKEQLEHTVAETTKKNKKIGR